MAQSTGDRDPKRRAESCLKQAGSIPARNPVTTQGLLIADIASHLPSTVLEVL